MNVQRLRGLIRKEFIQILRDPSAIAIAFIMPVILLFLFGYGVSLDTRHAPIAVVVDQPTTTTSAFIAGLQQSPFFVLKQYSDIASAQNAMMNREADGVMWLRNNFSRQVMLNNSAPVGVLINGVNANSAHILEGYLQGVWQTWLQQYAEQKGSPIVTPVENQNRIWFNPTSRSKDYLVPGLIAVIMTLIGALLTSLVIAREWERGTMEALMATPVTMEEILLGKLIPYFFLGMGGMLFSVFLAVWLFEVPLIGSFCVLLCFSALFLLTSLGMGLLISTVARNQFVACQIAVIVTYLPAFILSGFIFDIQSMPALIQIFTHIIPARYFVTILQTIFLAGNIGFVLFWNGLALVLMAFFFLGMTFLRSHKRLD
jgi:ABC-2 type transport system permease protein